MTSGQDSIQLSFQLVKKNLQKSLLLGVVVCAFNPSTWMAEPGGSLNVRPTWSTEKVHRQSGLGNESKYQKLKTDEDVIEQENLATLAMWFWL